LTSKGTGYDTYDLYDLGRSCAPSNDALTCSGEFDQKGSKETAWGTKEELLSAIKAAKSKGIITYIDAVLNHKVESQAKHR
jgi:alpha-amylase